MLRMDYLRSRKVTLSELGFRVSGQIFPGGKKMFRRENNSCARLQKCAKQELNIITRHSAGDIKPTGGTFVCLAGSIFVGYQYTHRKKRWVS